MPEPIYPVRRGKGDVPVVPQVEHRRLLSPAEREEARRRREEARKKVATRTQQRPAKNPPQARQGGVDYSV